MRIVMLGPFGLEPKSTMLVRAVPLARALVRVGHTVTVIMPPWHTRESARTWSEGGVTFIYVAVSKIPLLGYLVTTLRMLRAALAGKPEVIHCFKPKAYAGLAAYLLWIFRGNRTAIKSVVDEDDWEGAGGWNEVEPYSRVLKRFFSWQERWGLRHCDAVTLASRALQTVTWSLGVPPVQTYYLPNGASHIKTADSAMRRTLGLVGQPTVLVYSRFVEFSPLRLEAIWRMIHQELPSARLLVVGQALEPQKQAELEQFYARNPEQDIVHPGWVPMAQLGDYFASADVALFPCDDTLINRCKCSVKLTDLLTAGVPVVAEAVGQNSEYIEHNRTGWLVYPGDNEALAKTVVAALQDEGRARVGALARKRMLTTLGWDKLAQVALQAYSASTSP